MVSCFCLQRTSMSSMAVLALFLLFSSFVLGLGFFAFIFTSIALVLSTFFTTMKQNSVLVEEVREEEVLCSISDEKSSASSSILQKMGCQQQNMDHCVEYLKTTPDFLTESECIYTTTEDAELEWPYREELEPSQNCPDGSISDEESLIEITFPTGNCIRQTEEDPKLHSLQKKPEFSTDSMFRQHHLMDFLAELNEMNEEENLIEIDISLGSIKYSRFEIKA